MQFRHPIVIGTIAAMLASGSPSFAQDIALSRVASELGYTYAYLGADAVVTLSRPGLTIVFRPGDLRYDVNDQVQIAPEAPRFEHNDVVVSDALIARLRTLAARYPAEAHQAAAPLHPIPTGPVTISATHADGREAAIVWGTAAPSSPITIVAVAKISRDLPDALLSRTTAFADADGKYHAVIPIAPRYWPDSEFIFTAQNTDGSHTASTMPLTNETPNAKTTVPFSDNIPREYY